MLVDAEPVAVPELEPEPVPVVAAEPSVPVAEEPLLEEALVVETMTVVELPMDTMIEVAFPAVELP